MQFLSKLALISLCLANTVLSANTIQNNVACIIPKLSKTVESDTVKILNEISQCNSSDCIKKIIKANLPTIAAKIAQEVSQLNSEQRAIVIAWLTEIKALTAITAKELLSFGNALQSKEQQKNLLHASVDYLSDLDAMPDHTYEQRIALLERKKEVDMHNALFNKLKAFMCQCAWLEEQVDMITGLPLEETVLHDCLIRLMTTTSYTFDALNELYFASGWQAQFESTAEHYAIAHMICTELLGVITQ